MARLIFVKRAFLLHYAENIFIEDCIFLLKKLNFVTYLISPRNKTIMENEKKISFVSFRTISQSILCSAVLMSATMIGQIKKNPSTTDPAPRVVSDETSSVSKDAVHSDVQGRLSSMVTSGKLAPKDANFIVTSEHVSRTSGVHHIYYNQAIDGLKVYGTESSLHISKSGKVISAHNQFVKDISEKIQTSTASISPAQAIEGVAAQMGYQLNNLQEVARQSGVNRKAVYNKAGISGKEIPVQLMYYYTAEGGVNMVWELSVQELNSSDWWNFRINASSGVIIDKDNWMVSCISGCNHAHEKLAHEEENFDTDYLDFENKISESMIATVPTEETAMVGSYRVFAIPVESPYFGNRTLETNPDNATASPFGWHDTDGVAGAESTETVGNNVDAHDDIAANNTIGSRADGGGSLIFDFPFDATATNPTGGLDPMPSWSSTNRSLGASITNTFYWSNIIHDVVYQYGFDEAAGNFQENNYGNGGVGSDSVDADVQDGIGTCNANFGTPGDGGNPTMQMFTCGSFDGDYDNLVIVHEYGHGISNRLTGGASTGGCLGNAEQMGEGWSDFYGYMLTSHAGNATSDRTVGTFLFGQGPNGAGIRPAPYSTNLATNSLTYGDVADTGNISQPHGIGSIWATMLWEMTQALIARDGFDADLYNGTGGNNISLNLVTEALKLQPCSPGFVDGRDAILAADVALYGGANQCLIWEAFAKRGLGFSASQGSSGSRTDGVEAFDVPPIALNVSTSDFCLAETPTTVSGGVISGGSYSGPGVTDDGNGTSFTFDPAAAGVGTHTITYTATDCNGDVNSDTDTVIVTNDAPVMTCSGTATIALDPLTGLAIFNPTAPDSAVLLGGNNGSGGAGFSALVVDITDDVTITFDWLFDTTDDPQYDSFGYILDDTYFALSATTGDPQNSSFTIPLTAGQQFGFCTFTADNGFGAATSTVTNFEPGYNGQFDASNWVEVQQNSDGSADFIGATSVVTSFCDTATVTASQTTFTCLDIGTQNVDVTLVDSSGQVDNCTVAVTVTGGSTATTFSGGTWNNGLPTGISSVTISDVYDTASLGSFEACSCEVDGSGILTVGAGDYLRVSGDITVNGDLIVEHQGSVVQVDKDASVIKNGTINVELTTPVLQTRDFMVMGSPMTAETRPNVFANAFLVLEFNPTNFIPNTGVPAGGTNFADDNGDFYSTYNGTINPGEGYIVRPQSSYTDPANTTYDMTYELGTLNNGDISYTFSNNGPLVNPDGTPNVLANPYASAISASAFMTANSVSEVYFWEHITPPSPSLPGAGSMNFSMDDISYFNGSMGIPAANDTGTSTAPNGVISTGQGFAVRTSGAAGTTGTMTFTNEMRLLTGNTTLRSPVEVGIEIEKLTLNVRNDEFGVGSYTGIAFNPAASVGLDENLDTQRLATVVSLYTHLEDGSEQFGIQSHGLFDSGVKIPMGFSTQVDAQLEYRISKSDMEGSNLIEATVYLIDNYTGTITNLNDGDYSFSSGKGVFDGRFTVQFEGAILDTEDAILETVSVFPNPTTNVLNIASPRTDINKVEVYDVRGRMVSSSEYNFSKAVQFDLSQLDAAMYFVTISTESGKVTKRVIKK